MSLLLVDKTVRKARVLGTDPLITRIPSVDIGIPLWEIYITSSNNP